MPYVAGGGPQLAGGSPEVLDVFHSPNVFANNVQIALWQDPVESAIAAAIAFEINHPDFAKTVAVVEAIEGDSESPDVVASQQKVLIDNGTLDKESVVNGDIAGKSPAKADEAPPPAEVTQGETGGAVTVAGTVDETVLYVSPLTGKTYKVKDVTKQPGVVFPYDVATLAVENGTTVQAVCDNLRLLIINCFDPIKNQFPDAFMTCSFRKKGVGSPTSQHPLGMACDIQYAKASKADYYIRAQWVKDNTKYDQFLLEYKTTGTGLPWHHISFNKAGNRGQVCTFMNDKNCKGPGVTGLYDLSNG